MTPRPFRFGLQVIAADSAAGWRETSRRAESAGFDVILMPDHFKRWAPLPALAAAAAVTERLRLGTLVCCNDFRHPLMLAREAATVDVISDGRFELGIGAGYARYDYEATGIPFDPPGVRVERLAEAVRLIKSAWSGESVNLNGAHYTVADYTGEPSPLQGPGPPILIGGASRKLLGIAAREADIVGLIARPRAEGAAIESNDLSLAAVERKLDWVRAAAGERFASLELSCNVHVVEITDDATGATARLADRLGCDERDLAASPHVWIGTVSNICDQVREVREKLGISYYTFYRGNDKQLKSFEAIVPHLAGT
jgi:probable F420-dependent oxidoreductase